MLTVRHGAAELGTVHPTSLARSPATSATLLLLGGRSWEVVEVDWPRRRVSVVPAEGGGRSRWLGSGRTLSARTSHAAERIVAGATPGSTEAVARAITEINPADAHPSLPEDMETALKFSLCLPDSIVAAVLGARMAVPDRAAAQSPDGLYPSGQRSSEDAQNSSTSPREPACDRLFVIMSRLVAIFGCYPSRYPEACSGLASGAAFILSYCKIGASDRI
jgi:hypothetical protein